MKSISEQLSTYKSVHLNRHNLRCHFFGVPMLLWSVMILLALVPIPLGFGTLSVATLATLIILFYYLKLHKKLAILACLLFAPILFSAQQLAVIEGSYWIAIAAFVLGWIIQFIGHAMEKARPAFVDDLNQLIIGPLFLVSELYFGLGKEPALAEAVTHQAVEKRRQFDQQGNNS